jgi:hypothetical protein
MRAGNGETELAFPQEFEETLGHRPGSRLRLERRQTRSRNTGFCAFEWVLKTRPKARTGLEPAACCEKKFGRELKEYRFAYL